MSLSGFPQNYGPFPQNSDCPPMIVIVPCPECQGEGRDIRCGIVYEAGCGHGHRGDVDYGICQGCNGKGDIEEEQPPRTLMDLEQEDFDMIEAACR